uniref:Regulator of G protein signaling 2 n=1 Tax=Oncorhynchus kisutch TaxID=8019 RepID=A0A8C7GXP2_ONCKI
MYMNEVSHLEVQLDLNCTSSWLIFDRSQLSLKTFYCLRAALTFSLLPSLPPSSPADGKAAFRIFLKSEFCEENIEFWTACEEFRTISSLEKLSSRARSIYEEFIQCDAPKEINLDYQTKDAIVQSLCLPSLTCFLLAQKKVFSLMENNSYPRFIHSELYKELCAIARGEGQYLKS